MAKSVLLVEDEPGIAIALEFLLKREGYDLRRVEDGEAALEAVRENPPDLILLDVMLPKRDGFDVCQTVRHDPAMKDVKIVMMTAKGAWTEVAKGEALGADAYMVKPFSNSELTRQVRELLADDRAPEPPAPDRDDG